MYNDSQNKSKRLKLNYQAKMIHAVKLKVFHRHWLDLEFQLALEW